MKLTKSLICAADRCLRLLWLRLNHPEQEKPVSEDEKNTIEEGEKIGKLAQGYFGPFVDATVNLEGSDVPDITAMLKKTREEMAKGTSVICEAAFSDEDLYCAVDILYKDNTDWNIIEVKSGTEVKSDYLTDVALQRYVLEKSGVRVKDVYILHPDRNYVRGNDLDIHNFLVAENVTQASEAQYLRMPVLIDRVRSILSDQKEPRIDLSVSCKPGNDYCPFWEQCTRHLPSPNVFDMRSMTMKTKIRLYYERKISYDDLENYEKISKGTSQAAAFQKQQINTVLHHPNETYVDRDALRYFLKQITYPLFFLDFESMNPAVPPFPDTRPYDQIPFQYSLHYIEHEGGPLMHEEYLAVSGPDPRRELAERLCEDIPLDVCTVVYNDSFEKTRLRELAELFPDLSNHLLNIRDHIVDLEDPFKACSYYKREIGGSTSIKVVLPALFPGDKELDYHALDGVHNGAEAKTVFPQIRHMQPDKQNKARESLLRYCELDTLAMVRIWEELVRVAT